MKISRAFVTGLFFFCISNLASAALSLNGASVYQDLGREVFIGSLYLNDPRRDATEILYAVDEVKLQVTVLDTLSKRRWVNIWMQGMAINNPDKAFEAEAENLVELFDHFKSSLKKQDVFQVHYLPGVGTTIFLNDIPLMQTPGKELMHLFLRAWIGPVPPSTHFKEMILGNEDSSALVARLDTFKPSPERKKVIQSWLANSTEEKAAPAKETAAEKKPAPEQPVAKAQQTPAPVPQENTALESTAQESTALESTASVSKSEENPAQDTDDKEAEAPALNATASANKPQANPTPVASGVEKPVVEKIAETEAAAVSANQEDVPAEAEEEDNTKISVASILASRQFTNQVIKEIYSNIKYPRNAITRNQQGTVRLNLTIERNGTVSSVDIEEKSGFTMLDKAALAAIKRTDTFPPIPDEIIEVPQTISIPISFRLAN